MPCFFFIYTTDNMFQKDMLTIVDIAAPFIPYLGIKMQFNIMFITTETKTIFLKTFCSPVIVRKHPAEPDDAFTNCPIARIIKAGVPKIKSSPNNPMKNLGKNKKSNKKGKAPQNINLEENFTTFLKSSFLLDQ